MRAFLTSFRSQSNKKTYWRFNKISQKRCEKLKVVGIDTGLEGGFAIFENGKLKSYGKLQVIKGKKKFLDTTFLRNLIKGKDHIFIEKAQAMPKQGIVSTSRYLECFGLIQGICVGLGVPYTIITPVEWKRKLLSGMAKEKSSSVIRVNQLYQNLSLKEKDHHIADAILIGLYGINHKIV